MDIDSFIKRAFEHNLNAWNSESERVNSDDFCTYSKGLADFGEMIFQLRIPIRIYAERHKSRFSFYRIRYHAIDETGLSHGHIFGPKLEGLVLRTFGTERLDPLFGTKSIDYDHIKVFDCFDLAESPWRNPVNLEELRMNYLPLPNQVYFNKTRVYYPIQKGVTSTIEYGPTIYRSENLSFYLPFVELIRDRQEFEKGKYTSVGQFNVSAEFNEDSIHIRVVNFWQTRKYNYRDTWIGKISYDAFELIELNFLSREDEYTG